MMIQPKGSQTRSLACRGEAFKSHGIMESKQGLKEEDAILQKLRKQNDWRTERYYDLVRTKLFLEDIRAEFQQYPPQSLEEFEVHENCGFLKPQFPLEAAQVNHRTPLLKESSSGRDFQQYPSPSSFTFEEDSPPSELSEAWSSTQRHLSKRLTVDEIQEDHTTTPSCHHREYSADVITEAVFSSSHNPDGKPSWARRESDYCCCGTAAAATSTYRDSPTSTTLSGVEPDEQPPPPRPSHYHLAEMSDSSEQMELQYPCSSSFVYRDGFSDSEAFEDAPQERIQVMRGGVAAAATKTGGSSSCRLPSSSKLLPAIPTFQAFNSTRYDRQSSSQETTHHHHCQQHGMTMPEQTEIQANSAGEPPPPYSPWFAYTEDSPVSVLRPKKLSTTTHHAYQRSESSSISYSPNAEDFSELHLFQQASHWVQPWLQRNGEEALDDADLQFLFRSPHTKYRCTSKEVRCSTGDHARYLCRFTPKSQQPLQQQLSSSKLGSSRGKSKHHQESYRSIEQAAQHFSKQHSVDIPMSQCKHKWSNNNDDDNDDDEEIFPSVKSWEIQEDDGPRKKTSTQQQRCPKHKGPKIVSYTSHHHHPWLTSYIPSSPKQRSKTAIVPCSGRLFSWPGRMLMFNPNKVRFKDSGDTRSFTNLEINSNSSFGSGSLRRQIHIKWKV